MAVSKSALIKANNKYNASENFMKGCIGLNKIDMFKESYNSHIKAKMELQKLGGFNIVEPEIQQYADKHIFNLKVR